MNEVKTPKKPMMFYYGIFLAVIILFNAIIMPLLNNMRVKEVDYGTFIRMTTELNVDEVEIQDNQIVFSDKNGNLYKTGLMDDPALTQRLYTAGAMITRYGMSDEFGMVALETVTNQYLGGDASLACSAETQTEIDRQVVALIKKQYDKAMAILTENKQKLDKLAQYLYEKETITGEEFMNILNS